MVAIKRLLVGRLLRQHLEECFADFQGAATLAPPQLGIDLVVALEETLGGLVLYNLGQVLEIRFCNPNGREYQVKTDLTPVGQWLIIALADGIYHHQAFA